MPNENGADFNVHEDAALFAEAINFTSAATGFAARLIEKARAALTRREPAGRDFYDFDYAVQAGYLQPEATDFVALVRQKLAMPGNEGIDVSDTRRERAAGRAGALSAAR